MPINVRGIGVQNFKNFSSYQYCNFSSLSILVGKNGSGKSSFLQAAQLIFQFLQKANARWDVIVSENYQVIEIDKFIDNKFFEDYSDFTNFNQIINNPELPLIIDLVVDHAYDEKDIILSPIKYSFLFTVDSPLEDAILLLGGFKITSLNDEVYFTNNISDNSKAFDIKVTNAGMNFLLESFIKYINAKPNTNKTNELFGNSLKRKERQEKHLNIALSFLNFEKEFLYDIDNVRLKNISQQYGESHGFIPGENIVSKVKLFNGELSDFLDTDNERLKDALDIAYQSVKESLIQAIQQIMTIERIRIPKIIDRQRTFDKNAPLWKCFHDQTNFDFDFIDNNLNRFDFKGSLSLVKVSTDANLFKIVISRKDKEINLVDEGSGYWTLTYMIFTLGNKINRGKLFYIEEPESFLHPNFQASLADLFIEAVKKFDLQIIIETHSEYLIKRLQRRVAQSNNKFAINIQEEDKLEYNILGTEIQLSYVNDIYLKHNIESIEIDEDGNLSKPFPPDFMDVSIKEDLLNLKLKHLN